MLMKIPLIDLNRQIRSIDVELKDAVNKVIEEGWFVLGRSLERFERAFAEYCGMKFAIGVGSGTDALLLSLKALGIGPGDEVIVPCNTFIATAEAVSHTGATPVLIDIDSRTYNIDVKSANVAKKTKAIIPVHLYGQPADMDAVKEFAQKHDLLVVEDACTAHGATYKGKKVGSMANVGCFSFYPTKPLGAMGDGGMVTTNDDEIAMKVRQLRNHGRIEQNVHVRLGYTSRLDEIQAAVLSVKLKYLDEWNARRRIIAEKYDRLLKGIPSVQTPYCIPSAVHVYYLYVIRTSKRKLLRAKLDELGIEAAVHYPTPIHLQPAYREGCSGELRCGEEAAREILALPMFAELTDEEIDYICGVVRSCLS